MAVRIAEVVRRKQGNRLRVGFDDEGGVLLDAKGLDELEPGSFVEVEVEVGAEAASAQLVMVDGAPSVVAAATTALAGIYDIAARLRLRTSFSEAIEAEVRGWLANTGIDDPSLDDLTAMPFVTIDYESSKDLDQAVYVEKRGDDYVIWYALADAAYYVRPGTALFNEAMARGASFYLPGLTIPMLPRALSEGLCSLNEAVDRRALVFQIRVDRGGVVVSTEMKRARVHSRRKLTYDGVQEFVDTGDSHPLAGQDFSESMRLLGEVGNLRIEEADRRDVVRYDRVALELHLPGPDATRLAMSAEPRNDVQRWNEQVSLVTNIEGAKFLLEKNDAGTGLAGLFRVHQGPEDRDRKAFELSVAAMVDELGLDVIWKWRRGDAESLADYLERLPNSGPGFRLSRALQRQAMVMGRPSFFAIEPGPHFGIGADAYSRFSSPMREIVGIVTKHLAFHQLEGTDATQAGLTLEVVEAAAEAGNRSKLMQKRINREANKLAIDQLFDSEVDRPEAERPIRTATVMGLTATKVYLVLDDPPIEIKLYLPELNKLIGSTLEQKGDFELASDTLSIRVGDAVDVRLDHFSRETDHWILVLVGPPRRFTGE